MRIVETDLEIQREPFARPFAFKGSAFHEKWNLAVRLKDADGYEAFGIGGTGQRSLDLVCKAEGIGELRRLDPGKIPFIFIKQ